MRLLHVLVGLILFLFLAALAVYLIYASTGGDAYWESTVQALRGERYTALSAGIALMSLLCLWLLTSVRRPEPVQYISFDSEGGAVSLSTKAVRDFIQKVGDEFAAVAGLHPVLHVRGGAVDVDLDVRVKSGAHIPELCQMLQERVRESLRDHLGLNDVREVRVNVREIIGPVAEAKHPEEPLENI